MTAAANTHRTAHRWQSYPLEVRLAALAALYELRRLPHKYGAKLRRLAALAAAIATAKPTTTTDTCRADCAAAAICGGGHAAAAATTAVTSTIPTQYQRSTNAVSNAHAHTAATPDT